MQGSKFVSEKICGAWYKTRANHVGARLEPNLRGLSPLDLPAGPSPRARLPWAQQLKQELQAKLDQPRVGPRRCGCDHAEVDVVGGAADGVRGSKLCSVENVEELRAELQAKALIGGEPGSLEYREIEIDDSFGAKPGINSRFVSKSEIGRGRKTRSIEPPLRFNVVRVAQPQGRGPLHGRITTRHNVGPGAAAEKSGAVALAVREDQGKSALKNGHAINAPSGDELVGHSGHAGKVFSAFAEGQIENIADYKALRDVLRR
jgi:hypothetical protein